MKTKHKIIWLLVLIIFNICLTTMVNNRLYRNTLVMNENTEIWDREDYFFLDRTDKLEERINILEDKVAMLNSSEDIHWSNITSNYMEMKYLERILWLEKRVDKYVYKVIAPIQEENYERRMKEKYHNQ